MENDSNEIDLWQLLLNGFKFFKRRKWIILSFFLFGLLFSVSNFFIHPLEYKSFYKKGFIAQSSVVSNEILYDIINGLPLELNNAPEFKSLKGKLEANNNKETRLKVTIEVFGERDIDSIIRSITTYIDSIKILSEKFELTKKQNMQLLSIVSRKIAECDNANKNSEYINCIELIEKKQSVEKELSLNKIINFIEINPDYVFISNTRHGILNISGYSLLGIIIGFIAGFMLDIVKRKK